VVNQTSPIKHIDFWRWAWVSVAVLLAAGGVYWRAAGPVVVMLKADVDPSLPFDVQIFPSVVLARPGDVVKVVYRIHNNDIIPLEAYGKLRLEPESASQQVQVFLTQCVGLNAFQNAYPQDYNVVFRVQAAGLTGSSWVVIHHEFVRAVDR
jgi:hypothetical protein